MSITAPSTGTVVPIAKKSARDMALFLASRKLKLIPLPPRSKAPNFEGWQNKGTSDAAIVARWFETHPRCNYGILTAGLLVIDIDPRHGGHVWLRDHEHLLPDTWRFRSGGGGWSICRCWYVCWSAGWRQLRV